MQSIPYSTTTSDQCLPFPRKTMNSFVKIFYREIKRRQKGLVGFIKKWQD